FFLIVISLEFISFAFMIPFIIRNKVVITVDNTMAISKHEKGLLHIRVENRSFMPISKLKCHLEIYNPLVNEKYTDYFYTVVRGKSYQFIPVYLRSEYAGKIHVKVTGITVYDFFGVFALYKRMSEQTALFVLPRTYEIDLLWNR